MHNTAGHSYKRKHSHPIRNILIILLLCAIVFAGVKYGPKLIASISQPWNLTLVNSTNSVPDDWHPELTQLKNGQQIDSRIYPHLQEMFDACRNDGLLPVVLSSYRTDDDQQGEFDTKVESFTAQGYSEDEALSLAASWAAKPGFSEHQLGLAVDIDSEDLTVCSNEQVWEWMSEHCAEYGFILRYPNGKDSITGYSYEPWHFRYVGKDAAKEISEKGITLEEYLHKA